MYSRIDPLHLSFKKTYIKKHTIQVSYRISPNSFNIIIMLSFCFRFSYQIKMDSCIENLRLQVGADP